MHHFEFTLDGQKKKEGFCFPVIVGIMEKLDDILAAHVAKANDTKGKLLGAAFTVVNKDGESSRITSTT